MLSCDFASWAGISGFGAGSATTLSTGGALGATGVAGGAAAEGGLGGTSIWGGFWSGGLAAGVGIASSWEPSAAGAETAPPKGFLYSRCATITSTEVGW